MTWYLVTRSDSSQFRSAQSSAEHLRGARNLPTVLRSGSSMAECFHVKYLCFSMSGRQCLKLESRARIGSRRAERSVL